MASHSPLLPTEDEDFDAVSGPLKPRKPRSPNKNSNSAKLTALPPITNDSSTTKEFASSELSQADEVQAEHVTVDVKSTKAEPSVQVIDDKPVASPTVLETPKSDTIDTSPSVTESHDQTLNVAQSVADPTAITHQLDISESDELDDVEDLFQDYVPTQPQKYEKPIVTSTFAIKPAFVAPRSINISSQQDTQENVVDAPQPVHKSNQSEIGPIPSPASGQTNRFISHQPAFQSTSTSKLARRRPSLPSMPHIGGRRLAFEVAMVLAIVGLVGLVNKTNHKMQQVQADLSSLRANPEVALQQQTDNLIKTVGQLVTLPTGETPTVANVSDVEQAKQQSAFFANAQNGDKVLMYVKAKQAILYRPATDNIILVAPLTFNNAAQSQASSGTTTLPTSKTAGSQIKP